MVRRLLDTTARELAGYGRAEMLAAIRGSEGRTVAAEVMAPVMAAVYDVSNPELAAGMGADIVVLNLLDVREPVVFAVDAAPKDVVREVKRLTGRIVAVNLEPVDPEAPRVTDDDFGPGEKAGRLATPENIAALAALGADAVVLTGNPGMGVTNASLTRAVAAARDAAGDDLIVMAGKMHAAGSATEAGAGIVDAAAVEGFVAAGADVVLVPAPGTVPGCHEAQVREWVAAAHAAGALTMTTIGTSQEGADADTIRRLALMAKMTGTDIHHLGDCGYFGITVPENILAYSVAIRGRRHAYRRMAMSLLR
ncbi:hypothetical protein GCM10009530_64590 [Microbispora corallina]|uniref:DUF7916 domain-containing protein n=1 Tax=Microbispora corallina TaxID=83302 RepID=A0ABQ4G3F6_9ACTN|nr:hypothetical protein [Microbispora corallina]GIH41597.1 hypothetical protein Mco01_45970 [Microbispora corallina]